ncbi:FadR/GntR family transcriptional regulator [Xylophilus sp.]|uniref:FadR/GntR family transcriptional regulator n=1 Tax=Xylophilus sp. TaxID=2653893 RepID=UPI0013BE8344|nr:FadR/GntR family transcriptional regulator [Xylophilus sp.]KAF1049231.1 MAG: HTH-type transcriptional regulator LutR [Xylophilus sp.]
MPISPLSDRVYDQIRELIEHGGLVEGARLPGENDMSARFEVSRPVVRQALARLRSEGWVTSRRGAGNFVGSAELRSAAFAPLQSVAEVRRFLEFRCVIEGECAAWAARCQDKELVEEISTRRRLLEVAIARGGEHITEDIAFHEAVARASGNEFYLMTMSALRQHRIVATRLIRELSPQPSVRRQRDVRAEHLRIEQAIVAGDADEARCAMVAHLRGGIDRLFGKGGAAAR